MEVVKSFAEILAIIIGAVWAYYKYIRFHIFRPRLALNISSIDASNGSYIVFAIELKNLGASDIYFHPDGTAATVEMLDRTNRDNVGIWSQDSIIYVPVLKDHDWIGSGEPISEQHLVHLPSPAPQPLRIRLRVVSQGKTYSKRRAWVSTCVAIPQTHSTNGEIAMERLKFHDQKFDEKMETERIENLKKQQQKRTEEHIKQAELSSEDEKNKPTASPNTTE